MLRFSRLVHALSSRLWDPLDPNQPGAGEIKKQLERLWEGLETGQVHTAQWQHRQLCQFVADWDSVAPAMPAYAASLRTRFLEDEQRSGYLGARAELSLAGYFLRRGVPLARGAPPMPDFVVPRDGEAVLIESTSAHLSSPREDNFYKINSAIRQKTKQQYCGPSAILHVDYTAILNSGGDTMTSTFLDRAREVARSTNWGAVLLGAYVMSLDRNEYCMVFDVLDGPNPSPTVRAFLDEFLPRGEHDLGRISVPPGS